MWFNTLTFKVGSTVTKSFTSHLSYFLCSMVTECLTCEYMTVFRCLIFLQTAESDEHSDELRGLRLHFEHQYQCDQCGKWFRWAGGRNEHIRIVHEGRQAYKCALCSQAFSTSTGLKRHSVGHQRKQPHSSDERQYQCDQCGKCFRRLSGRKQHIEIVHEGRRPYECMQCPRTFSTTNGLKRHLSAHMNKHPRSSKLHLVCKNMRRLYFECFFCI